MSGRTPECSSTRGGVAAATVWLAMGAARLLPKARSRALALCCAVLFFTTAHAQDAASQTAAEDRGYISVGAAALASGNIVFTDTGDGDPALPYLYGDPEFATHGDFDVGGQLRLAAGYRLESGFRAQVELSVARSLELDGNSRYDRSGEHEPASAKLDMGQLLFAAFYDFAPWRADSALRMQPYLGAGAGVTGYSLTDFVQDFPNPDDPTGYLRRGPNGEIPFTGLPDGSGLNSAYMVTGGVTMRLSDRSRLDLSYRYTDAGVIETDVGDINIVRYRRDGSRRDIPIKINKTVADLQTHAVLATLRFEF